MYYIYICRSVAGERMRIKQLVDSRIKSLSRIVEVRGYTALPLIGLV